MSDFRRIEFAAVPGGPLAACERLPDMPALYSFFMPRPVLPTADKAAFLEALHALIEQRASPTLNARAGSLHSLTLENFSVLSQHKREVLEEAAEDEAVRCEIAAIVDRCMPLRSPLYVGQTATLKSRVKQHLSPSSPLASRLRATGLELGSCTLCYRLMPDLEVLHTPAVLQLTEEIVTRILRPGYVARIG